MGGSIQVPNNIEDKTVLKRFLTDLVLGINGNTLFSGNIQQQNAALVDILQNNPTLDFLNLVAKLNELRTDILTYVEDNLETVILQNTEDVAVIAEQFGTFYEQALAASWYGLSVKAGGAVAGLEIGSLDPDVTTPNDEKSYFRVVADNFIVGRAYEDLSQEEKDYLSSNGLPSFGTVYNASKQPVPALITTWSSSEHVYKHYFNGIVQFTNISGTPTINKTYVQATAPSVAVIGDTWLNSSESYASFTYNGSTWVSTGNKTYMQPSMPTFGCVAGDIWIDTDDNNISYRYNGSSWISTRDTSKDASIAQALAAAANAQEAADGKIESFFQTTPPASASIGDLWFDTDDGNKVYRYNGSTWVSTQDSKIAQAIADAADAQATADGKITTYYQSSPPSSPGVGDLWVNSSNSQTYRWSFSQWILLDIATAINAGSTTINGGKITTNSITADRIYSYNLTASNASIANGMITNAMIGNAQITTAKIADAQITTAKIADAQITNAKIGDVSISNAKIQDLAVSTFKIGDEAVTLNRNASGVLSCTIVYTPNVSHNIVIFLSASNNKLGNGDRRFFLNGAQQFFDGGIDRYAFSRQIGFWLNAGTTYTFRFDAIQFLSDQDIEGLYPYMTLLGVKK